MSDLTALGLRDLVALLRDKKVSPFEAVEAHLAKIEALNPTSHAFITICGDRARAGAASVAGKGPFHGAP